MYSFEALNFGTWSNSKDHICVFYNFSPFLSKFSWGHKLFFWNVLLELMFCRRVHLETFSYYPWIDTENRDPVLPQGCQTNSPFLNIFAKATLYFESSKNFSSFAKIFPMRSKLQKNQFLVSHDHIYIQK